MNAENPVAIVAKSLTSPQMQEKFKRVLPPNIPQDRFTSVTLTAIQKDPSVLEADRGSLYNACLDAAQRGLLPDKKEGALVVFNTKRGNDWIKAVQFMAMPEGIIKEMAKAGVKAHAVSVYEGEDVEIWNDDDGQHFKHVPNVFGKRGERIGAVAWAKDADGRTYVEAMNMDDLARVAAVSRSKDKNGNPIGPWRDWPERMGEKSALHRLRKRIAIIGHDDVLERLQNDEEADVADAAQPAAEAEGEPQVIPASRPAPAPQKRPRGLQAVVDAEPPPDAEYAQAGGDDDERDMF